MIRIALCTVLWPFLLLPVAAADKATLPAEAEQQVVRERLRGLFKKEYAKTDPTALAGLAEKLLSGANEEKPGTVAQFVMLAEAMITGAKGGELALGVKAGCLVNRHFTAPGLPDQMASAIADGLHANDRLKELASIARAELAKPTDPRDLAKLAGDWQSVNR